MARSSRGILAGMLNLETEIQRIFQDMFASGPRAALASTQKWCPPTDVFRTREGIVVRMELAGLKLDEIDLRYEKNTLVVRGVRHDNFEEPKEAFWQLEIAHGPFERVVELPAEVDPEKIDARLSDGFLIVRLALIKKETVKIVRVHTDAAHDA